MIHVSILCVGKLKEKFYLEAVEEYTRRLAPFCRLTVTQLSETRLPDRPSEAQIAQALRQEGQEILARRPRGAALIPLCVEGEQLTSPALAWRMEQWAVQGGSAICFVIGGSYGLDEAVKAEGVFRLSMSRMTFPHHLARVMLLEQIYRAFQIQAGTKYHK
ncbi:MAG TPA: 23S rRNA (pseudouridine(1915)-N(3))-methyltransferase RlmH [Candidatus Onthomonas avicola]|nr:23S rRNA (pseudouridine(1915)-N(3))-methyltransferase RlmH [Candidatus Onthomonas avicola]